MKKIVSLFLVLTMCMSMMPVSVFSEDETTSSIDQSESVASDDSMVVTQLDSTADTTSETTPTGETGSAETAQPSEISLDAIPLDKPFNLEEAYDYYLTLEAEEAELFLASLSDDNRFMLLDYIDAMNEISALEAEAAAELAKLEAEAAQELQEDVAELAEEEAEEVAELEADDTDSEDEEHIHSYSQATCTEPEICSCGDVRGDALGHQYKDGVCLRCGASVPSEPTEEIEPETEVTMEKGEDVTSEEVEQETISGDVETETSSEQEQIAESVTEEGQEDDEIEGEQEGETTVDQEEKSETTEGSCGSETDNVTWILDNSGTLTISGTGTMADYTYQVIDGVYSSTAPWSGYVESIFSVVIEEGVTKIGNYAFYRLSALSSITIPEGVTTVGKYAFYKCTELTSITLPSTLTSIGNNAFTEVTQINFAGTKEEWSTIDYTTTASVICSDGDMNLIVEGTYRDNIFWSLSKDGLLEISGTGKFTYTGIDDRPWINYNDYILSGKINKGVTEYDMAFAECTNLKTAILPENAVEVSQSAFRNCTSLIEIDIPDTVVSIKYGAFSGCTSLTEITISDRVESIDRYAFRNCTSLEKIILSNNLSIIPGGMLYNCTNLKEIVIPDSVEIIGNDDYDGPFYNCSSLSEVIIPDTVKEIRGVEKATGGIFSGCTALKSVTISDSLEIIQPYMFYNCSCLESIIIPDAITEIGQQAFANCTSLKSISIPEGLSEIGISSFYNCKSLTNITFPDSIVSIRNAAFYKCSKITSITIPTSVTSLGTSVFAYCTSLESVIIKDGITELPDYTFQGCSKLTSVSLPNSLTSIGSGTFSNTRFKSIILPENLITIGGGAFTSCISLQSLEIPEKVKTIGQGAFYHCTGLKQIKFLGDAPTSIGGGFYDINIIAYYPGTNTTWNAFSKSNYDGTITWIAYGIDTSLIIEGLTAGNTVYANGVNYTVSSNGVIDVPLSTTALMTFTYSGTSSTDAHVQYPTGVKVYAISIDDDGNQVGTYVSALENVLTYSGASIKTVDNQGLRIIYSIPDATKTALIAGTLDGLSGYTLAEFGTVATWADTSTNPYLGCTGAMTSYSYRASESYDDTDLDTELNYSDTNFYYTNAFVFTNFERTKPDLAVRPYMILNTPDGDTMTIYGGVVIRNIGYVAYQCRDMFTAGTIQYEYIHEIIDYVYPDGYTEWTTAQY